jgi:hypothetical protein
MGADVIRSGEHRIRDDLAVEFVFDDSRQSFEARWTPRPPARLTPEELALYRRRRSEFLQRIAEQVGGKVAVVEL